MPLPSTFMPLPLPMMIPFMGIQSAVMAKQFGENFQYGKRRISAMTNEEFNKLTPLIMLQENASTIKSMIPTMEQSLRDMRPMTEFILLEFVAILKRLIELSPKITGEISESIFAQADKSILDIFAALTNQTVKTTTPTKTTVPIVPIAIPQQPSVKQPTTFQKAEQASENNLKQLYVGVIQNQKAIAASQVMIKQNPRSQTVQVRLQKQYANVIKAILKTILTAQNKHKKLYGKFVALT